MAKLDRYNKFDVKIGDIIDFGTDAYVVTETFEGVRRNTLSFTLRNVKTKAPLYCYPSHHCYGAEWIPQD